MSDTDLERGLGRRLIRNLTAQSLTQVLVTLMGLVTTYVLTRTLDVASFGGFTYIFATIYIFLSLNDLGINITLVREIAQYPERTEELVQNVIGLRLVLALISVVVGWIVVGILAPPAAYQLATRVFFLILPIQAFAVPGAILQANIAIRRGAAIDIVNRTTGFVLMMLAVWMGQGLLFVTIALVCGEIAGALMVIALTRHVVAPRPRFDFAVWRRVMRTSLPLGGQSILIAILNRFDSLMLERLGGMQQLAFYGAAYRLPSLFERVPQLVMATVFPIMSRLAVSDPVALKRLYHRTLGGMALLAIPVAGGVIWLAPLIVGLWFPAVFESVGPLLRVVILATAVLFPGVCAGSLLIALNKPRANLLAGVVATALNIGLNFLWIPTHGAMGAAWATVVSLGVLCTMTIALAELALNRAVREHGVAVAL